MSSSVKRYDAYCENPGKGAYVSFSDYQALEHKLKDSERSESQLITQLEFREEQINKIADELGDHREWSSANDRGDNCIESINILQSQIEQLTKERDAYEAALNCRSDVGQVKQRMRFARHNEALMDEVSQLKKEIHKLTADHTALVGALRSAYGFVATYDVLGLTKIKVEEALKSVGGEV